MIYEYYNNYDEEQRLKCDKVHRIEYLTTMHLLMKHLPLRCSVLDCCAGAGIYAFSLAKAGYKVTAGDLIQKHVDLLNNNNENKLLEDVYLGNVIDLTRFPDGFFDAVLCLGALYHLQSAQEREKAVGECIRVLKKDGIFAFSYINRNACFINHFKRTPAEVELKLRFLEDDGSNAVFYAMSFGEADKLMSKFAVRKITVAGTDGLIYVLYDEINGLDDMQFAVYMKYQLSTCTEPSIIGHSMHGLWIGRKQL